MYGRSDDCTFRAGTVIHGPRLDMKPGCLKRGYGARHMKGAGDQKPMILHLRLNKRRREDRIFVGVLGLPRMTREGSIPPPSLASAPSISVSSLTKTLSLGKSRASGPTFGSALIAATRATATKTAALAAPAPQVWA